MCMWCNKVAHYGPRFGGKGLYHSISSTIYVRCKSELNIVMTALLRRATFNMSR